MRYTEMRYTEILALAIGIVVAAQLSTTRFTDTTTSATETSTPISGAETTGTGCISNLASPRARFSDHLPYTLFGVIFLPVTGRSKEEKSSFFY
jgi:hypothetical protein